MRYSSPCQLLGFSFQLLPPSLPLLLVRGLLVSGWQVCVLCYCGGVQHWITSVEYCQPLAYTYFWMTSVTTAGTCYLLERLDADAKNATTVVYASLISLIQGVTSVTSPTH